MPALSRDGRILRLLLRADGPLSGQLMGEKMGISRSAVGKAVEGLRAQGFAIEARPRQGYRLLAEPDAVLPCRVEARRESAGLGLPLLHFPTMDSTNLEARRAAEAGAPHGLCLVAEHQSAGRGRLNRRWIAPSGTCLLFSLLLRPPLKPAEVFALTNLAALAVCRAVEGMSDLRPAIKWPNDVFLDGRKLAGVLTEFACRAESLEHVVVGAGLNVNLTPSQLGKLPAPAASLRAALGAKWDRAALLAAILDQLDALYVSLLAGDKPGLAAQYNARSHLLGKQVQVRDGEKVLRGRALEVAADGALLIALEGVGQAVIRHGDVSVLGIAD